MKSQGPRKLINAKNKYQERLINATKEIQFGVILGVILGCPKMFRVSGAQKVLGLINILYVQLIIFGGVSL